MASGWFSLGKPSYPTITSADSFTIAIEKFGKLIDAANANKFHGSNDFRTAIALLQRIALRFVKGEGASEADVKDILKSYVGPRSNYHGKVPESGITALINFALQLSHELKMRERASARVLATMPKVPTAIPGENITNVLQKRLEELRKGGSRTRKNHRRRATTRRQKRRTAA